MSVRCRFLAYSFWSAAWLFFSTQVHAECFDNTVNFEPSDGYSWNTSWQHCIPNLPENCVVESAKISVRSKVWSWGWYPYE